MTHTLLDSRRIASPAEARLCSVSSPETTRELGYFLESGVGSHVPSSKPSLPPYRTFGTGRKSLEPAGELPIAPRRPRDKIPRASAARWSLHGREGLRWRSGSAAERRIQLRYRLGREQRLLQAWRVQVVRNGFERPKRVHKLLLRLAVPAQPKQNLTEGASRDPDIRMSSDLSGENDRRFEGSRGVFEPAVGGQHHPLEPPGARDVLAGVGAGRHLERLHRELPCVIEAPLRQGQRTAGAKQRDVPAPAKPSIQLEQIPGSLQVFLGLPVLTFFKVSQADFQQRMPTRLRPQPHFSRDLISLKVAFRCNI